MDGILNLEKWKNLGGGEKMLYVGGVKGKL